ncbi:MAG: hypothetical protein JXL84_06425 [Deltaproteobacteria bacterium]|nr:hypothetical protein [Deltaproteobacteria bacterium]
MRRWLILIPWIIGSLCGAAAFAEEGTYNSRFASIHYQDASLLDSLARKIQPSALTLSLNRIFMGGTKPSPSAKAGRCVDHLFQRVQVILEMPKPELKVHLRLYRNQDELSDAFSAITGRPTEIPAFYWTQTNTIYLNLARITPGILAHEMGHAVIAHYFIVSPPEKIAELLCQYVDREVSRGNF